MAVLETSKNDNEPGVYKHPETGVELVAHPHPKFGNAMADGFVAAGFVFVGPEKEEQPKETKGNNK